MCIFKGIANKTSRHHHHRFNCETARQTAINKSTVVTSCIARYDWLRALASWHHDRDVIDQTLCCCRSFKGDLPCFERKFNIKTQCICDEKYVSFKRVWSRYSGQLRFFLVNALYIKKSPSQLNCIFVRFSINVWYLGGSVHEYISVTSRYQKVWICNYIP